ncbi:cytidylyltransferase domain-containing protein [Pseudodesulfovibrio nedwellii]|nr:acylneuraminate cytidylyltransferase family protein [Pseudodesulfovibrio nedwellii]
MKIGALVPARIGSCRVPKKNIRKLMGKPLLFWTLDAILEADCFDDVCVSTESEIIASLVREYYGPHRVRIQNRPEELATNTAPMKNVVAHYLESVPDVEFYGVFLPTYPFRRSEKIQNACRQLHSGHLVRALAVTETSRASRDLYYPVKEGVKPFFRPPVVCLPYMSACYTFDHRDLANSIWRRMGYTTFERVLKIPVSREENIDIDTEDDFRVAQAVASGARFKVRKSIMHRTSIGDILLPEGVDVTAFSNYLGDRLPSPSSPVLCLKTSEKPSFMYTISDADSLAYFCSDEASKNYSATTVIRKTANNSDQPQHYVQSSYYRVLPKNGVFNIDTMEPPRYHPGNDGPWPTDECVPWDRVIHMEDMRKQPFYVSPVELVTPEK